VGYEREERGGGAGGEEERGEEERKRWTETAGVPLLMPDAGDDAY